jgi:hypothetical protein
LDVLWLGFPFVAVDIISRVIYRAKIVTTGFIVFAHVTLL